MSRKRTREQKEAAIARGDQAKLDLENTAIVEAFRWVEHEALQAVRQSVTPDQAHRAAVELQTVGSVLAKLRAFIADGKEAAATMARELEDQRLRRAAEYDHENYLTAAREARLTFDHSAAAAREEQPNG